MWRGPAAAIRCRACARWWSCPPTTRPRTSSRCSTASGPRCPTPTCSSSTTAAPTAPPTWPRSRAPSSGPIAVLRRAGKAGLGLGLPRRLRPGPRRGLRGPRRDGLRPPARPGRAARAARRGRATAPTSPSAPATCPAAPSPTGSCTGGSSPRAATATPASCSASRCATPPPASGPTGPRRSAQIDLDRINADGYGFQIEMAYVVAATGGRIVEVPITLHRPHRGARRRCRAASSSRRCSS